MREYTPTTEKVREGFAAYIFEYEGALVDWGYDEGLDAFNRWLAQRDAEQQRTGAVKALREARGLFEPEHFREVNQEEGHYLQRHQRRAVQGILATEADRIERGG